MLKIENLSVEVEGKVILEGVNLEIEAGQVHVIMGPNGSGKSTLTNVLAGHPSFKAVSGQILFKGKDLLKLAPEERAQNNLFVSFQHPVELPGVSTMRFLHTAYNAIKKANDETQATMDEFEETVNEKMEFMGMCASFKSRGVNEGCSGGEKKRNEILQMAILEPSLSVLDEIDSGLDIDSLREVASCINKLKNEDNALLLITHYNRILQYIEPDFVHVLVDGQIVQSGDSQLPLELEAKGYQC